jgi:hypothetical protein
MARTSVAEPEDLAPSVEELATAASFEDDIQADADPVADTALAQPGDDPASAEQAAAQPQEQQQPDPKTVDLRALQEARAEAREAKRHAAVLEQRWNDFLTGQKSRQQPQEQAPATPEMPGDDDPLGQLKWLKERHLEQEQSRAEAEQRQQAQAAAQRENEQVYGIARQQFSEAVQADPSVGAAFEAVKQSVARELSAFGLTGDALQAEYNRIEAGYVRHAIMNRIPLANYIKGLAAARGWQPGGAVPGAQAAAAAQPSIDPAKVAQAQQRHMSLSDAPGGAAPAPMTAKDLAAMSDKDFNAWMSKRGNESRFEKIMGNT